MKKAVVFMAVMMIIYGCGAEKKEEGTGMKTETVAEFQRLMDEETEGDRLAVNWDGVRAEIIDDALDDPEVSDGRGGNNSYVSVEKENWETKLPAAEPYEVGCDEEEQYYVSGKDWELEISKVEIREAVEELAANDWMQAVTKRDLSQNIIKRNENAALYRGLKKTGANIKAGYVLILEDYFENSWKLSYFGEGNMNDVKANAMMVFENFRTIN